MFSETTEYNVNRQFNHLDILINNINEIFYTYDLTGKISYVSSKCIDFLGYQPEEGIGKFLWEFVPVRQREDFTRLFIERLKNSESRIVVLALTHKDGSERFFRVKEAPIIENGQHIGKMALAEDITERKKAQRSLKESNEALERLKEELVASNQQLIAHEEELRQQLDEIAYNKEALRKSEERYRNIMESIQDGYFETDRFGNFVFLNRALHEKVGYSAREMLTMNYRQVMDIRNADQVFDIFSKVYATGQSVEDFGWYVLKRDGESIYVETTVLPILDADRVVGFRGIIRDFSERRKAEMALRRSENMYRTIFENTGTATIIIDEDMTISLMNSEMVRLSGYSREEMEGKEKWPILIAEQDRDRMETYHLRRRAESDNTPDKYEFCLINKQGMVKDIVLTVALIPGTDKSVASLLDITERKIAEKALQDSEIRLRKQVDYLNTLINNMNELFFTYDTEGRIVFVNKKSWDVLGYSAEYVQGKYIRDFVREDSRYRVDQGINDRLSLAGNDSYELPIIARNEERIIKLNSSSIIEDGQVIGGMVLADDITDRKRAEAQLIMSEARYRAIIEDQTELICRFLADGTITFVNEIFCRYFDRKREAIIGSKYLPAMPEEDRKSFIKNVFSLTTANPVITLESRVILSDNQVRWQQWTHRALFGKDSGLLEYQSVGRDITERKQAEDKLAFVSLHDPLTGIFNRLYFEEEMKRWDNERNRPLGLIMCDVDGLKLINDTLGHDKGDQLLIDACRVISKNFREEDVVARVGGDEFAVLLPGANQSLVEECISRIRQALEHHNESNIGIFLSVSMGFAVRTDNLTNLSELYREADNNMYRDKLYHGPNARNTIMQNLMSKLEGFSNERSEEKLRTLINRIARSQNFDNSIIKKLYLLAQFHDIGNVGLSENILFKPGPLTSEEYDEIKRHCEIGQRIALYTPDIMASADWILKHHEWWNGKGYPLGLKGTEIPLECRIMSIICAYDAMTSDRPYRKAILPEDAILELRRCAGTQFDPGLVDIFVTIIQKEGYI